MGSELTAAQEIATLLGEERPMDVAFARSQTVICTLGMHRSGTSLVSRVLNLLGVHLGEPDCIANVGADNPKGYWEHNRLASLNDEILTRFGGRWDEPPLFAPSWFRDPRLVDLRAKARHLLAEQFSAEPLWGWKDPRTCLTLPFWQDLIGAMRYVICLRNPCAVVASLGRRNGMASEQAERLWLTHVQSSLAHTSGQPRLFVFYEDLINDFEPELRRMAAFVGGAARTEDPRVRAGVGEFLEQELCHHRMSLEEMAGDQRISFATKSLYLALRGHAPRTSPLDHTPGRAERTVQTTLDLIATHAIETFDRSAALTTAHERLTADHHRQLTIIDTLGQTSAALSGQCDELGGRAAGLLQAVASLESGLHAAIVQRDDLAADNRAQAEAISGLTAERDRLALETAGLPELELQQQRLRQSVASLESELQAANLLGDTLAADNRAQADAIAGLTAERNRLAVEAAARHELKRRERQLLQSVASLQSGLQATTVERDDLAAGNRAQADVITGLTAERDDQARQIEAARLTLYEIHDSSAWRLVTFGRRVIIALLPAGTRRRRAFTAVMRRIARRAPEALQTA